MAMASSRTDPAAHYLRGRLFAREDRHRAAAEAFESAVEAPAIPGDGAAQLPSAIANDARARRAAALAHEGDCDAAIPLLDAAGDPVSQALAAECTLRLGHHREAVRRLKTVIEADANDVDTFAAGLELAEALSAVGQSRRARQELRRLYVEHAAHPDSEEAWMRLSSGPTEAPRLSEEETLTRAEGLLSAIRPEVAATLLEGRLPRNRVRRAYWLHLRGMALFKMRTRYAEAATALAAAARARGPTAIEDAFHSARALSRADDDAAAIRAYRRLARQHPSHRRAAHAEYLAAWLEVRKGRHSGVRRMERFLEGPRAGLIPSLQRDAQWQLGLAAFEAQEWPRAVAYFGAYARLDRDPMHAGRGLYWKGRALAEASRSGEAVEAYRAARALDPLHYYGVLAQERLAALGIDEPIPLGDSDDSVAAELEVRIPAEARFYRSLGLDADAAAVVRHSERALRSNAPSGRINETLARAHLSVRSYHRAFQLASRATQLLMQKPSGTAQWAWDAAYPRPAFDVVVRESRRGSLPWSLTYAVMRQESGYDADAVSHAGAVGWMQVMPEVGRGGEASLDQLFVPEINVRLGVAELSAKLARCDHLLPLAVAAYNAGEGRVDRWRREAGPVPFDLFVEKISFDETRNYVRRVLSHFARYRYLATGETALALPQRVVPPAESTPSGG